jgi:hypothetical protein
MHALSRTRFQQYVYERYMEHGQRFNPPTDETFIDAFNKGDMFRVKVVTMIDGKAHWPRWGYVGITTGWSPAFLLMKRRGAHGSSDLLNPLVDKVVETKWLNERPRKRR